MALQSNAVLVEGIRPKQLCSRSAEAADLIMMPSHGYTFDQFLLGSVTAKILHGAECPVWTDAHVQECPGHEFAIRNVLCAVDFSPRSHKTVTWAAQMAAEFSARLTLAHVTPSLEIWGPGGNLRRSRMEGGCWSAALLRSGTAPQEMGIKAGVLYRQRRRPHGPSQAAKQTKADLLVTGCYPYGGHLRTHGYAIICAVPIPVLNV